MNKENKFILGELATALVMACWIWSLNWLSAKYLGKSFLLWYVEHGSELGFIQAIIYSIWDDINKRENMISVYPCLYCAEYFAFVGAFVSAIGPVVSNKRSVKIVLPLSKPISNLSDIIGIAILSITILIVLLWMIFIVPIQYFIFLVLGSPARLLIKAQKKAVGEQKSGIKGMLGGFDIRWESTDKEISKDQFEFTFHDKPLTLTLIITGIFFWIIGAIFING